MGISIKNTRSADFCADQIHVITNFAVITNAVIKRVHSNTISFFLWISPPKLDPCNNYEACFSETNKFSIMQHLIRLSDAITAKIIILQNVTLI